MTVHCNIPAFCILRAYAAGQLCTLLFFFAASPATADTVFLDDGTVLTGKIIEKKADGITFRNSYGVFEIKTKQVQKQYVTNDYREDVAITRKQGLAINEGDIKRNYEAGSSPSGTPAKKDPFRWDYRSVSVFGVFNYTTGKFSRILPFGQGVTAAFDQGPDMLTANGRRWYIPGFRAEAGYLYYKKGGASIKGFTGNIGAIWKIRPDENHNGAIVAALLPGVSRLDLKDREFAVHCTKLSFHALAGYDYAYSDLSFFVHARYLQLYDTAVSLRGAGLAAGIGYRL